MQDEFIWLEIPFHKNKISFDIKDNEEVLSSLKISFDGSIMAVKKSCVEDHYIDQNVKMIKAGYESLPKREKGFKINDSETLYKVLSFYVEI
tara:strand:+ start:720 stop:995 length:276 start_codon:yes stop_codon:yes gene_type:complete